MADQPDKVPEWASGGSADVVEPSAGKKALGWVNSERPPAEWFNWLLKYIYLWCLWLSEGLLRRSSLTDNTPVLATCDRDGNERHYIGPEGYLMGPAIQEQVRWSPVNNSAAAATGAAANVALATNVICDIDANIEAHIVAGNNAAIPNRNAGPVLILRALNAASNQQGSVFAEYGGGSPSGDQPICNLDDVVAVMEWRCFVDDVGTTDCDHYGGLHSLNIYTANNHEGTVNYFAMFHRDAVGPGTWQCKVCNGSAKTTADSGVTITAGTWFTMRVELHGANTPVGVGNSGSAVARFFIDGTEVHEETGANVPSGTTATLSPFFATNAQVTGPTADNDFGIGNVKFAWNEVLDPDVPA